MMDIIQQVNSVLHSFIWGRGTLIAILFTGILLTVRTGFFQFTHWKLWMGQTLGQLFQNKDVHKARDDHSMSQFQAFCTALAATLGTGNITGVASALIIGGPGAIFWMWISALVGMMTTYGENLLGIRYRWKNAEGRWIGGAMVYMERGLGCKWLAVIFAFFCLCASLGMGNMTQANSVASGLEEAFSIPPLFTGVTMMLLIGMVLLGGMKRIALVAEKLVPVISIFYLAGTLLVILVNFHEIPGVINMIFKEAFQLHAAGGGVLGYGIGRAIKVGISRGVFSNEAGLGSSVMAHAASEVDSAPLQGMWAMLEVFIDTIIFCTLTSFAILTSGVYDSQQFLLNLQHGVENIDGTTLTGAAFATVIPGGDKFLALSIIFFAFATIIGWAYFGERTAAYLFGERRAFIYKIIYILALLPGCIITPGLMWEIADTCNGFMALPNIAALLFLNGEVVRITKDYLADKSKIHTGHT